MSLTYRVQVFGFQVKTNTTFMIHSFVRISTLMLALASLLVSGCVDRDFDTPPAEVINIPEANTDISELKAMYATGGEDFLEITDDLVIRGVVIANDRSGNFFKTIVIQDETAGIELKINSTGLFGDYPLDREIAVKLQGLTLGDYNGVIQVGNGTYDDDGDERLSQIEEVLVPQFIFKGNRDQGLQPQLVSIADLGPDDISTLVQLEDVQFSAADAGETYADAANLFSINRIIESCDGGSIILRSSGYADFANNLTPTGNGTLTAVYSVFRDDQQLFIRDESDIEFDGARCGANPLAIADVRAAFNGTATQAPSGTIRGVVISDRTTDNVTSRNLFLEGNTGGIAVRFMTDHSFSLGEEIELNISGTELSEFNGLLQVNNVGLGAAISLGTGNIIPEVVTVDDLLSNFDDYESELVTIQNATLTGGPTFGDGITVNDGTGSIQIFTRFSASFSGATFPSTPTTVTAIVSEFNSPQLILRDADDVDGASSGGGGTGGGDELFFEDFQSFNAADNNEPFALPGWTNTSLEGNLPWISREFSNDFYAQINPYQSGEDEVESWLVTPAIAITSPATLTFNTANVFWDHDGLEVLISTDYDGSNVAAATWTNTNATVSTNGDANYVDVLGTVDLTPYNGQTIYVGFKYTGNGDEDEDEDGGYQLDDIKVEAN